MLTSYGQLCSRDAPVLPANLLGRIGRQKQRAKCRQNRSKLKQTILSYLQQLCFKWNVAKQNGKGSSQIFVLCCHSRVKERLVYSNRTVTTLDFVKNWHLLTPYSYTTSYYLPVKPYFKVMRCSYCIAVITTWLCDNYLRCVITS